MYDLTGLELITAIGLAVVALTALARRTRLPPSALLFAGGVGLSYVPMFGEVRVAPEVVILIFLPILLYWEARNTSLREIRSALWTILSSAVLLVLVTAAGVAVVAHEVGGLAWPVAFVLGAVVAPTDATAVGSAAGRLPYPQLTALRAESLINDGTALVLFSVAVSAATGMSAFSSAHAVGEFTLSYLGGVLVGWAVAYVAVWARWMADDRLLRNGVSVMAPFATFLVAELVHGSGVVAVVTYGLVHARLSPRWVGARTRLQSHAFWGLTTFLLNGALFVLLGLQLKGAVADLDRSAWGETLAVAGAVMGTVVAARVLWFVLLPAGPAVIGRPVRTPLRARLPGAWAGFRGAVSLAAALAIPSTTIAGDPFPARAEIIVVTFLVIMATLVGQGLTLPLVLRMARFTEDTQFPEEQRLAERRTAEAALEALAGHAERLGTPSAIADRVRADHERDLDRSAAEPSTGRAGHETALRLALLPAKRGAVLRLRDDQLVDDVVALGVEQALDREEARLRTRRAGT